MLILKELRCSYVLFAVQTALSMIGKCHKCFSLSFAPRLNYVGNWQGVIAGAGQAAH